MFGDIEGLNYIFTRKFLTEALKLFALNKLNFDIFRVQNLQFVRLLLNYFDFLLAYFFPVHGFSSQYYYTFPPLIYQFSLTHTDTPFECLYPSLSSFLTSSILFRLYFLLFRGWIKKISLLNWNSFVHKRKGQISKKEDKSCKEMS